MPAVHCWISTVGAGTLAFGAFFTLGTDLKKSSVERKKYPTFAKKTLGNKLSLTYHNLGSQIRAAAKFRTYTFSLSRRT